MIKGFFQESLLAKSIRLGLLASLPTIALVGCSGDDGEQGPQGEPGAASEVVGPQGEQGEKGEAGRPGQSSSLGGRLIRLATVAAGAEVTGAYITEQGDLFFNVQHPDETNETEQPGHDGVMINTGTIGVVEGLNINKLPNDLISTPIPLSDEEKETVRVAYGTYKVLGQNGDTFSGGIPSGLGTVLASDGQTIADQQGWVDFNGFIPTAENGSEGYLFTNWEYFPGGMSRMKLKKDLDKGTWSVDNTDVSMLDFGDYGTIANCFGSVSPWGTPLTSEEWGNVGNDTWTWNGPNLDERDTAAREAMALYIDPTSNGSADSRLFPNTYRYHYIVEITEPTSDAPIPQKRYALGRYEHENAIVMPDQKTVYLSQDNTDGVFYKFVADEAADLSVGTLYAAKLTQDKGVNDPSITGFDIEWKELAHGDEATIEGWIKEFDAVNQDSYVENRSSYLTDADAIAWAAGAANYGAKDEVSQDAINAGYEGAETYPGNTTAGKAMDNRIAFLESRKAARAKGATAEWRKFEGIYANQKRAKEAVEGVDVVANETVENAYVYFAISDVDKGMIDGEGDIQLNSRVKDCGGVYRMKLEENYDVIRIEPVVMGATQRSVDGLEKCDANYMAQPDNIVVMDDGRILVGEDGGQANNSLWLYDPRGK